MAEMLQLGRWISGVAPTRGIPLQGAPTANRAGWEQQLLDTSIADWATAVEAPPQRVAMTLGGTLELPGKTRLTNVAEAIQMALLNRALIECNTGLVLLCLQRLDPARVTMLQPVVLPQLAGLLAPFSASAYSLFCKSFERFLNTTQGLDLAQVDAATLTRQAQIAEIASLCATQMAPLVNEGCRLLAEALVNYTHVCRNFDVCLPWLVQWTQEVAVWQTRCNPQLLHKAKLVSLYHYLRGLHDVWMLASATEAGKRPTPLPPPVLPTPVPLLLKEAIFQLPDLAKTCRSAEQQFAAF